MRRTTICRSKASVALALILLGAATARAQEPQQPAAQQPTVPPASLPATHLVQSGETLWSLAQHYFGDPLLWPEIYRLNTDVVEDPHWIFPGEELRIAAPPAQVAEQPPTTPTVVAVAPDADTTQPQPAPQPLRPDAPTIFTTIGRRQSVTGENLEVTAAAAQPVVSQGEYYSAPWLTEGEAIATGRLLGNVQASNVRRLSASTSAQQFNNVAIQLPGDAPQPGELVVAVRRAGAVRGFGEIVLPTGLLRVTSVGPDRSVASVVTLYGQVHDGQEIVRLAPWQPDTAQPVEVSDGLTGSVVGVVKAGEVVQSHDAIFIDKGSEEGVRPGDTFQLYGTDIRADMGGQLLPQAEARIINVRPHTATAVITRLVRPDVRPGSTARQIRRVPG